MGVSMKGDVNCGKSLDQGVAKSVWSLIEIDGSDNPGFPSSSYSPASP